MRPAVRILASGKPKAAEENFAKLARFLGIDYEMYELQPTFDQIESLRNIANDDLSCIVMSGSTLADLFRTTSYREEVRSIFLDNTFSTIVYNILPRKDHLMALRYFTDNKIETIDHCQNNQSKYEINKNEKQIAKQLSGMVFGPINTNTDLTLRFKENTNNIDTIISINGSPFFVKLRKRNCELFLLASTKMIDIDTKISEQITVRSIFSQLLPHMMFLKHVFKDMCWHAEEIPATFVIDDALLRENYGYLNYKELLHSMDKNNFAATIAFIPWNYKRTATSVAKIFSEREDRLSLCAHGCDHTANEFSESDMEKLTSKIRLATDRMTTHKRVSGVDFDRIMVFPQGVFSAASMQGLRGSNYCAVVNTTPYSNEKTESDLTVADLLDVAILKYNNFPLFLRRYPEDLVDFAIDAFLEKPLLIVEHHSCFRRGYERIGRFVRSINLLSKNVKWMTLGRAIMRSYLVRLGHDGTFYCNIYCDECLIENRGNIDRTYVIQKVENGDRPIKSLMVNGNSTSYQIQSNVLRTKINIKAFDAVRIKIEYEDSQHSKQIKYSFLYSIKIRTRRYLSEFRDNYLARIPILELVIRRTRGIILSRRQR